MSVNFREVRPADVEELYSLIVESTKGLTRLTADRLEADLFSVNSFSSVEVAADEPVIEFHIDQLETNVPVERAIVAEVDGRIIGYLIFHNHYTPWIGYIAYIDDLFVITEKRKMGIGRALVRKATEIAKAEGFKSFLFSAGRLSSELQEYLERDGESYWYRNDETDWSVLRIEFNNNNGSGDIGKV